MTKNYGWGGENSHPLSNRPKQKSPFYQQLDHEKAAMDAINAQDTKGGECITNLKLVLKDMDNMIAEIKDMRSSVTDAINLIGSDMLTHTEYIDPDKCDHTLRHSVTHRGSTTTICKGCGIMLAQKFI